MKTVRTLGGIVLACFVALAVPHSAFAALRINLVYIDNAPPPPPDLLVGGGSLKNIMEAAADAWESVFQRDGGKWDVTIEYGWAPLGGGYGKEMLLTQGGNRVRITRARILFNNDPLPPPTGGIAGFFADPSPRDNSEYLRYTLDRVELPGGQLTVGRVFSEAIGDAAQRVDLLTIATHELGHALGLEYNYVGFIDQFQDNLFVEVTAPRPFAGFFFTINNGPHLDGFGITPLMTPDPHAGSRQLVTAADALLISQVSSFDRPDLSEPPLDTKANHSHHD